MSIPKCDSYLCEGNTIGTGAYGRVSIVRGTNSSGTQNYALKECRQDSYQHGIFGINEPVILMSLSHPFLMKGIEAKVDSVCGYYVQELGKRNLLQQRSNGSLTMEQKKKYCHQLAQAVKMLHSFNIVHGDIKSANVVMYHDDSVSLIDFSLSFITRDSEVYYTELCTANYRPPEVVFKKGWKKSVDIWCLGCVFYEIYYGKYLFTGQSGDIEKDEATSRMQMTNLLADWNDLLVNKYRREPYPIKRQSIEYSPLSLDISFDDEGNEQFNHLLVSMMEMLEKDRFDIDMVLSHPYFQGEVTVSGSVSYPVERILPDDEEKRLQRYLETRHLSIFLKEKVQELYRKIDLDYTQERDISREANCVDACTLILSKMYRIPCMTYESHIYRMEREIANILHFRLLPRNV